MLILTQGLRKSGSAPAKSIPSFIVGHAASRGRKQLLLHHADRWRDYRLMICHLSESGGGISDYISLSRSGLSVPPPSALQGWCALEVIIILSLNESRTKSRRWETEERLEFHLKEVRVSWGKPVKTQPSLEIIKFNYLWVNRWGSRTLLSLVDGCEAS